MIRFDRWWHNWRHRRLPQSHDLVYTAYRLAAEDSARYQLQHMRNTADYAWDLDLHRAVTQDLAPGVILEFGVATGRTLRNFARLCPDRAVHGFDSWQGLPEDWNYLFPQGSFRQSQPRFREPNIHTHAGWFDPVLSDWLGQHTDPVALIHIDCDLYTSTRTVLNLLQPRIRAGTRIIFDEYCNYPGWQQDEFRAWQEFRHAHGIQYRYIGRVTSHQQVAIEIC